MAAEIVTPPSFARERVRATRWERLPTRSFLLQAHTGRILDQGRGDREILLLMGVLMKLRTAGPGADLGAPAGVQMDVDVAPISFTRCSLLRLVVSR